MCQNWQWAPQHPIILSKEILSKNSALSWPLQTFKYPLMTASGSFQNTSLPSIAYMAWLLILDSGGIWHLLFCSQSFGFQLKLRQKNPILTSSYKCFYVQVKWFLQGMENLKMNSCPVLSKHLAISVYDDIFSRQNKKLKLNSSHTKSLGLFSF